jgi:hypothetical protein
MTFENILAERPFNDGAPGMDAFKKVRPELPCHVTGCEQNPGTLRSGHVSP